MAALTPAATDAALARLWDALPEARLVGGAVRDLLAGRSVSDYDLATPASPGTVQRVLADRGIRTVPTGLAHGTVTAVLDGRPFEITTLRRDVRTDGRHAETEWTDDWQEDAARRDFTMNAMSLDRAGTLHDHFGGEADLRAGRVRFVGEAARRILEDHLRILRFFRFLARYGRGAPDAAATDAIRTHAPLLRHLSPERVWSEMRRLLASSDPLGAIELMAGLGVLAVLLPDGAAPDRLAALLATDAPPDPLLRLAALTDEDEAALAARWRLSGEEGRRLAGLRAGVMPHPDATEDDIRRWLAAEPAAPLVGRACLAEACEPHPDRAAWARLRATLEATPRPVFPLAGRDVVAAGVPAGPEVGAALGRVGDWGRGGGAGAGRAACLERLREAAGARSDFSPPPRH